MGQTKTDEEEQQPIPSCGPFSPRPRMRHSISLQGSNASQLSFLLQYILSAPGTEPPRSFPTPSRLTSTLFLDQGSLLILALQDDLDWSCPFSPTSPPFPTLADQPRWAQNARH